MEPNQIVRQFSDLMLEQQRILCELARNDLLIIESSHSEVSQEVLSVAAATVRSTLYSVDALTDRLRSIAEQARNR